MDCVRIDLNRKVPQMNRLSLGVLDMDVMLCYVMLCCGLV